MIRKILLPIDPLNADAWQPAITAAIDLARRYQATLALVWVAPPVESAPTDFADTHLPALETAAAELLTEDIVRELHLRADWGDPDREICAAAEELGADLVVMGTHQPQLGEAASESNAANVVLHAKCSVYVVR